eukprot:CAMPEP_0167775278 /NCGR_PEP_ID=MMETSP0111_2-20121227/2464_1 /TAXON_ID=91324 /ORGANISM="Lotharella globosa, Strain CCCM811" /LENGTH=565 /DNA_ID=CAMNT_0007665163 /DNA_START=59 /DNA_END=1759 /DNA_ORIENTATION=-
MQQAPFSNGNLPSHRSRRAARRAAVASAALVASAVAIASSCSLNKSRASSFSESASASVAVSLPPSGLGSGIVAGGANNNHTKTTKKAMYTLRDLSPVRRYTYDRPTLEHDGSFAADRKMWTQASTFWEEYIAKVAHVPLTVKYPDGTETTKAKYLASNGHPLRQLNLTGLAIFGGSLVDTLLGLKPKDVDMCFFCAEKDPEQLGIKLAQRVERLVSDLNAIFFWADKTELLVTRYKSTYEISHPGLRLRIQVVPRPNLDALLQNTEDYTSLAFVVADHRHLRQANRLRKAWEKGFDIILPGLNVSALPRRNLAFRCNEVLDLPHLTVVYSNIEGNRISAERVYGDRDHDADSDEISLFPVESASSLAGYGDAERDIGSITHHNIRTLAHGANQFVYFGQGENWRTVFAPQVPVTERALINTYETVRKSLVKCEPLPLSKIEAYYTVKPLPLVFDELLVKYCSTNQTNSARVGAQKRSLHFTGAGLRPFKQHLWRYLKSLTMSQIDASKSAISELNQNASLAVTGFDTEPPCSPEEWYGKYFAGGQDRTQREIPWSKTPRSACCI